MKKTLLALAVASAGLLAVPAAFAQNAPTHNDGWFVNGNVGRTSINRGAYDGNDVGYGVNGGYRWAVTPSLALGVEAGYTDLGNIDLKGAYRANAKGSTTQSQLHGWTAGVNGHFNVTPNWYVSARTGLFGYRAHGLTGDIDNPVREHLSETSWYAGAGVGYDFSNNMSVGLNFDHYNANKHNVNLSSNLVSMSAEYRF